MNSSDRDNGGRNFRPIQKEIQPSGVGTPTQLIPNRVTSPTTPKHGGQVSPAPDGRKKGGLAPEGQQTIPNRT